VIGKGGLCPFVFFASLGIVEHRVLKSAKELVAGVKNVLEGLLLPGVAFCVCHVLSS
jgi:hypothetical protein